MVQDTSKIKDCLVRIYGILEFTSEEVAAAMEKLAKIQQAAVSAAFLESLTPEEVKSINDAAQKSDQEKKAIIEQITQGHAVNEDFKNRTQAEIKKVISEHTAYLKTRGDDRQKNEIAKILAEFD